MNESPTANKLAKWKRPLMSGLLSGLIAGVLVILNFFAMGFLLPVAIVHFFLPDFGQSIFNVSLIVVIFWFAVGIVITTLSKNNRTAIVWWLLTYFVCAFITIIFAIFFSGI